MPIATLDLTTTTKTVRRHAALERFARYMLIYNLAIFLWSAGQELSAVRTGAQFVEVISQYSWRWAALVLGSVAASYMMLAHRWIWAYGLIFLAQIAFFFTPSPDKPILLFSVSLPLTIFREPRMLPLAPLATELAVMTIAFVYVMAMFVLYSAAWLVFDRGVPAPAYGPRRALLEPLRPSRLLDTRLAGQRSQRVSVLEASLFALSSLLFVVASMAFFYGIRRVQNAFGSFASDITGKCAPGGIREETIEATVACIAGHYPWSRAGLDLGVPIAVAALALFGANVVRKLGRRRFLARLADRPIAPTGATLFLRAFRDDQVRIRRASRNLFSLVFDLGRSPATLDELMLERLEGRGDLVAIGNPQDRKGSARRSPWGAQRLYVGDAEWQATAASLARAAERIILCIDASDGVKWEIAHVLENGHAAKTLFVLNPELDAGTRQRLLSESLAIPESDLAGVDVLGIIAVRIGAAGERTLMLCRRPERDAYLVAARLAFATGGGSGSP